MGFGVARCSIDADLTPVSIRMGAKQSAPMPHFTQSPTLRFGPPNGLFNRFVGMTRASQAHNLHS